MDKDLLKKVRSIDFRLRRKVNNIFSGEYRSTFKGQGIIFSDFREYIPGDDIRSISWNMTAKMSRPFIKTFEEERENHILLVADISGSFDFGTGDHSKRDILNLLGSLLALCAQKNRDPVGLLLFSDHIEHYIPPKKNYQQSLRIIRDFLAHRGKSRFTNLKAPVDFLQKVLKKRSHIFFLSDFLASEPFDLHLRRLSKKHDLISLVISDPMELEFPDLGLIEVEDLETKKILSIDTSSKAFQNLHKKQIFSKYDERNKKLNRSGSELIFIETNKDIYKPLLHFFQRRKFKY